MIIKHKEFTQKKIYEMDYCGRPLRLEVGRLAELANAAVLVQYGETTVLVTVTASPFTRSGVSRAASCAARADPLFPPCWPAA